MAHTTVFLSQKPRTKNGIIRPTILFGTVGRMYFSFSYAVPWDPCAYVRVNETVHHRLSKPPPVLGAAGFRILVFPLAVVIQYLMVVVPEFLPGCNPPITWCEIYLYLYFVACIQFSRAVRLVESGALHTSRHTTVINAVIGS